MIKANFKQEIISNIIIIHYNSGTFKAEFTKRTTSGKKIKEHLCYLLFKEIDGRYRITGESDNLTDQNKNITLNLGEPVRKTDDGNIYNHSDDNSSYKVLLFLFAVAAASVAFYFYKKKKDKLSHRGNEALSNRNKNTYSSGRLGQLLKEKTSENNSFRKTGNYSKQKGDAFEKYIVERFDKASFKLIEWRSDKIHNGVYAASSQLPDLEYHFKTNDADCYFAVECKWRKSFVEGKIQ